MPDLKSPRSDDTTAYAIRLSMLFDLLLQDVGADDRDRSVFHQRLADEGFSFVSKSLPLLSKALDRGLADGKFKCPSNFKRQKRASALPALLGSLWRKIFDRSGFLRPSPCPVAIKTLRTICLFAYKCDLPRREADDQSVIDRFVSTEVELSVLEIEDDALLNAARIVTGDLFSDFKPSDLVYRHGPGVTSNCDLTSKYEQRLAPLPAVSEFSTSFFFNEEDALTRLHRYPVYMHADLFKTMYGAKVILVPKDSRGPRLISCEPVENQWVQQGIARYMIEKLESSPLTVGQVNFTDQTINRRLAAVGSVDQTWATLDLKDASDRVSLALVNRIFANTKLYQALMVSRSAFTVLPNGDSLVLKKFAPMGSALCFPVMAYCIFILLYIALIGVGMDPKLARASIFVYGDDVIVPNEHAQYCMDVLERYGLRINRDKSFVNSPFLESCGMDAFRGVDVTPIRLKQCPRTIRDLKEDPQKAVSLVETANHLSMAGYRRAAQYLYGLFEQCYGKLLYGYPHSPYLSRWMSPSETRTAWDWNVIRCRKRPIKAQSGSSSSIVDWGHKGHFVAPVELRGQYSIYGHFMRIWSQLGGGELPLPGVFDTPKTYAIATKVYSRLQQSQYPGCFWTP